MKESTTSSRLKTLITDRNMRQVDILNACLPYCQTYNVKMNKSDISQYLSGKAEPNQGKLFVLASALGVSEAWLMGYDVPSERIPTSSSPLTITPITKTISKDAEKLLDLYHTMNSRGQNRLLDTAEEMSFNPLYNEDYLKVIAAHERTDIKVTAEMIQHDNDIMNDDSEWE